MNTELIEKINIALNGMRPFLQADGGDVEFVEITEDMEVRVRLKGSCSSCDISHITLKAGIENGIKNAVPQIRNVVAID
ncbi:MAG: NifU family protein [Bacteroidetes bacterium]|nr:NifU family protein [Bacteroidota bacterium]